MTGIDIARQPKYVIVTLIVFLTVVAFAAWLPNLHLITKTMTSSTMTLWQKTNLLVGLLGSLQTNFTPLSRLVTVATAALAGVQVSLLIIYIRQTAQLQQSFGMSFLGVATSMLGIGCASCGSVVLTSLIGFGATTVVLGFLPLNGQEFGLLGIAILIFAIHFTMKKINDPQVCEIQSNGG